MKVYILQQKYGNHTPWYSLGKYKETHLKKAEKKCLDLLNKNRRQDLPGYKSRIIDCETGLRVFPVQKKPGE